MVDKSQGRLRPGAKYIYEKVDGVVYAREHGAAPDTRIEIGRDFNSEPKILGVPADEVAVLVDMYNTAKTNPALQDALDRAIIVYKLIHQEEFQTIFHHPV